MSANTERFARIVLDAFALAGHQTDAEIGAAGGPSTTTLTKYRNARDHGAELKRPRPDVFRKIERAARWSPGSARALWERSEDPRSVDHPEVSKHYLNLGDQAVVLNYLAELRRDDPDAFLGLVQGALSLAAQQGDSHGRALRREQDDQGEAPDPEGPETGA